MNQKILKNGLFVLTLSIMIARPIFEGEMLKVQRKKTINFFKTLEFVSFGYMADTSMSTSAVVFPLICNFGSFI